MIAQPSSSQRIIEHPKLRGPFLLTKMEPQSIMAKVQDLSDIELALLLCLIANQHCIIHTTEESFEALEEELQLVCALTTT